MPAGDGDWPARLGLAKELVQEASLRGDVLKVAAESQRQRETALRTQERDMLALAVRSLEQKVDTTRQAIQNPSKEDSIWPADCRTPGTGWRNRASTGGDRERPGACGADPSAIRRALGRTVDGHESLPASPGRLAVIPLEPLLATFKSGAMRKVSSWPTSRS